MKAYLAMYNLAQTGLWAVILGFTLKAMLVDVHDYAGVWKAAGPAAKIAVGTSVCGCGYGMKRVEDGNNAGEKGGRRAAESKKIKQVRCRRAPYGDRGRNGEFKVGSLGAPACCFGCREVKGPSCRWCKN